MVFVESRANCRPSKRGFRALLVLNAEPSRASVQVNFDNRVVIFGRTVGSNKVSRRDFEFSVPRTKPPIEQIPIGDRSLPAHAQPSAGEEFARK